jgi:hypothetical protein
MVTKIASGKKRASVSPASDPKNGSGKSGSFLGKMAKFVVAFVAAAILLVVIGYFLFVKTSLPVIFMDFFMSDWIVENPGYASFLVLIIVGAVSWIAISKIQGKVATPKASGRFTKLFGTSVTKVILVMTLGYFLFVETSLPVLFVDLFISNEAGLYLLAIMVLFPFVAYVWADWGIFLTNFKTGEIILVERFGQLIKIMHDAEKKEKISDADPCVKIQRIKKNLFGIYWVGIWPFDKIHKFKIKRDVLNPDAKNPEEWVKHKDEVEVDHLRRKFQRPYRLLNVELGDGLAVHLLILVTLRAVKPKIPVFIYKGDFFGIVEAMVKSVVSDVIKSYNISRFLTIEKGLGGILKDLNSELNAKLEKAVGLILDQEITIVNWDPSDEKTRVALEALGRAGLEGEAKVTAAGFYDTETRKKAGADAFRIEQLALAEGKKIAAAVESFASKGADGNTAAVLASEVLVAESIRTAGLHTYVTGNGENRPKVVIPIGQNEKGGKT